MHPAALSFQRTDCAREFTFIQHGIEQLLSHLPAGTVDPLMVQSYNKAVAEIIDGVRDVPTLHYYASTSADNDFWRATKDLKFSDAACAQSKVESAGARQL